MKHKEKEIILGDYNPALSLPEHDKIVEDLLLKVGIKNPLSTGIMLSIGEKPKIYARVKVNDLIARAH